MSETDIMAEGEQVLQGLSALESDHKELGDEGAMSLTSGKAAALSFFNQPLPARATMYASP